MGVSDQRREILLGVSNQRKDSPGSKRTEERDFQIFLGVSDQRRAILFGASDHWREALSGVSNQRKESKRPDERDFLGSKRPED